MRAARASKCASPSLERQRLYSKSLPPAGSRRKTSRIYSTPELRSGCRRSIGIDRGIGFRLGGRSGRRFLHDGRVGLRLVVGGRVSDGGFFFLARREKRDAGQEADVFFHIHKIKDVAQRFRDWAASEWWPLPDLSSWAPKLLELGSRPASRLLSFVHTPRATRHQPGCRYISS
jgi:hypothetical protein